MPNRDAVEKQLENEFKSRDTELQNLGKALQTAVEKYQKDAPTMNATQRANTEKDLVAKREAYAQKHKLLSKILAVVKQKSVIKS